MADQEVAPTATQRKRRLVALLAELADVLLGIDEPTASSAVYSKKNLPPGSTSWRQILDLHRGGALETSRVGKSVVVTEAQWQAYLAKSPAAPKPRREKAADPLSRFPRRVA